MEAAPAIGGLIFVLFYIILMGGMVAGWIFFLVAMWRAMKAHESIAGSLKKIAEKE